MAERRRGESAPATESTVTKESWDGRDISGEEHTRVLFSDVDFTEVVNRGATFTECIFRKVKLNCSVHTDSAFVNCTFSGCSFFDVKLTDCKLVGTKFDKCTFDLMEVRGGNWSHVGLPGADLRRASFQGVRLREADLTGARCDGGSLRDLDLAGASLDGVKLTGCDLRGSDLSSLAPAHVDLTDAIVTVEQAIVIATALGLDVRAD